MSSVASTTGGSLANFLDLIVAEAVGVVRLDFMPESWREPFAFALRGWFACMLALYLAFFLEIDQPYWAGMTVWISSQPTPGMAVSKGVYRVVGTIVGAVVGVVLIALFAQTPALFILTLGLWIGVTTLLSNLLTNFRGYAAVLGGYTAAIVSLGAYDTPNQVFDIALARGAETLIGIGCMTLITVLFAPHRGRELVTRTLQQAISDTAQRVSLPLGSTLDERIGLGRPLVAKLIKLDSDIEFGSAESSTVRIHAGLARSIVAHLFAAVAAKRSLEQHLERVGLIQDAETDALYFQGMRLFKKLPDAIAEGGVNAAEQVRDYHRRIWRQRPEDDAGSPSQKVSSRLVLDRLGDIALHLERAAANWADIQGGWKRQPRLRLNFHRDRLAASINGLRAFLSVLVAGAFWVESAWPAGAQMLTQFAVGCALFSSTPHPDAAAMNFLKGALLGVVSSYVCTFHFLAALTGFVPFALVQLLFLLPGAMIQLNPRIATIGLAYCVFFIIDERPLNPMDYNPSTFLNNALATVVGAFLAVIAFRLFLPPDPARARRYVIHRMRSGLKTIAEREPTLPYWEWQTLMFDRVNRLSDPANPSSTRTDEWFEGGLGALQLGNEVLRLRRLIGDGALSERLTIVAHSVLQGFNAVLSKPDLTRFTVQSARATLQENQRSSAERDRRAWCRFQGIVGEMEAFFLEHPRFLTPP